MNPDTLPLILTLLAIIVIGERQRPTPKF